MKEKGRYIGKMIKDNFLSLAGFEFVFKASALLLFIPLVIKTMNLATDHAGVLYITTKNIAKLMKNPVMIVSLLVSVVIFICISFYEECCIWSCYYSYSRGRRIGIPEMFTDGFSRMKKISRRYRSWIWIQMAAIFPLMNFLMMIILFRRIDILENCVKYIFRGIPEFLIGIITALFSVTAAAAALRSFGRVISGKGERKKDFLKSILDFAVLNIITGLMLITLYLILVMAAAVIIRFTGDKHTAFAQLMKYENIIYYFLAFTAGAAGITVNTALMYVLVGRKSSVKKTHTKKKERKNAKKIFATVLILFITAADISAIAGYLVNGSQLLEEILISTTVTAHRGGAKFVPENTMYGVNYAIESGAEYIEIDVQLSSDGVVFLLHDENLKRTTGANKNAYNLTYDEISRLDAGSYFKSEFSDAYIPTLDEVLTACKSRINLNIELKKSGNAGNDLPDKVLELINSHDMQQQCVITSTEYPYLKYVKQKQPEIRTGYIANMLYGNAASLEYADFFSVKYVVVTEGFVRAAHSAGKEVHVWTVNTKPLINRMKGLDVDSIITDNPVLCRKILSRKNDRKSFAEILQTLLYK